MSGMQEEFTQGVRELLKATRPHVNCVKDFERRAKDNPRECAEEAQREIMSGLISLQRAFEEAFGISFEEAFKDTFYLTRDQQYAIKEEAHLPDHPVGREFFLLWLYWLHFHRLTLDFFVRRLRSPNESHEERARSMCACFVSHQVASWCAYLMVADDIAEQFPDQAARQALVEQFTAFFVAHTSLNTNKRLWKAMDELKEQGETPFGRLIKEVSGEVLAVWREKRTAWKGRYVQQVDLMEMRTEIARRLEKQSSKRHDEVVELAEFVDREEMARKAKAAKLSPQELEFYELFYTGTKPKEVARQKGVTPEHARQVKHRIFNKLLAAGL
jgi:hypothetical protein